MEQWSPADWTIFFTALTGLIVSAINAWKGRNTDRSVQHVSTKVEAHEARAGYRAMMRGEASFEGSDEEIIALESERRHPSGDSPPGKPAGGAIIHE